MMTRRQTQTVCVGNCKVGSDFPVRIEGMTNVRPDDVKATLSQISSMASHQCDIVRVAVPDNDSAEALKIVCRDSALPVIADIHFRADLAYAALLAGIHGIRLNPTGVGNREVLEKVALLVRENQVSVRVGINSGSLSKKFLRRDGKITVRGMVDSALENIDILEKLQVENIMVSLKASDVQMTLEANKEFATVCDYPIQIGVTHAGAGMLGATRATVGATLLLQESIGDVLRISVTCDPTAQVRIAYEILSSLGYRQRGPNVISCPKCGRCEVDIAKIISEVDRIISKMKREFTVAVMGCEVNGPGEARVADYGLAISKKIALIFAHGEIILKGERNEVTQTFLKELSRLAIEN